MAPRCHRGWGPGDSGDDTPVHRFSRARSYPLPQACPVASRRIRLVQGEGTSKERDVVQDSSSTGTTNICLQPPSALGPFHIEQLFSSDPQDSSFPLNRS